MHISPSRHHTMSGHRAMRLRSVHPAASARITTARHSIAAPAVLQAMLGASTTSSPRSVLIPLGMSFVTGTLGWLYGGFWWSMAAGAAGYIAGEALRQR